MSPNQATTLLYTVSGGVAVPVGTMNVSSNGQLIFTPSGGASGGAASITASFEALPSLAILLDLPSVGVTLNTTYAVLNGTILSFYTLIPGGSANQPADYNATTNNVSWLQTL